MFIKFGEGRQEAMKGKEDSENSRSISFRKDTPNGFRIYEILCVD